MSEAITLKEKKIAELRVKIASCERCDLHQTRANTVPGEGDVNSPIMFIGEAPGKNEDLQGKPFIGRAGNVFSRLLESIGLTREDIYLCNILKCRPPNNRNPLSSEIQSCVGSLDQQIKIINPVVIGTLGNFSTTYIFQKFGLEPQKISSVVGKCFPVSTPFGEKVIIPTFHPAVATYNVHKMDTLINDFQIFKMYLNSRNISASDDKGEGKKKQAEVLSSKK